MMEMFAIFLCVVIGHASGAQQWAAMGKDDFKAGEVAEEGLPLYVKEANYDDQYLQSKDVQVPTRSSSSNETETDEKPKALVQGSVPVRSVAIRYAGKDSSIKTGRSFRRNSLDALGLGETNNEKLLDIPKHQEQQTGSVMIPQTGEARKPAVSHSIMRSLLDKHPEVLKTEILITDDAEKVGLENYVKSQSVPTKSLHAYNSAMNGKREFLKLLTNTSIILPSYKSVREGGITRNTTRFHDKFREFFRVPSTALEQHEALEIDELTSLESFLSDSGKGEDSVEEEESRLDETRKVTRTKRAVSNKRRTRRQDPSFDNMLQGAIGKAKKQVNKQRPANGGNRPQARPGGDRLMTHGFRDPKVTCNVKVQLNKAQINEIVNAHNAARRREKASNMLKLTWDPIAAKVAQQKASACEWGHSMTTDCKRRPLGQNLFSNYASDEQNYIPLNLNRFTMMWANENKDWNYRTKTCTPGRECGHWQTLTGARIRAVGCGFAKCPKMRMQNGVRGHVNHLVCDYFPAIPSPTFETGAPCSKCAKVAATTPEKGWICENKLCVPCHPKKKKGCKPASMADDL